MRVTVLAILSLLAVLTSAMSAQMSHSIAPMEFMLAQVETAAMRGKRTVKSKRKARSKTGSAALAQGKGGAIQKKGNFAQTKSKKGGRRRRRAPKKGNGVAV